MFFSAEFHPGMGDLTKNFEVKNGALLKMCEDTAGFHCDTVHDGLCDVLAAGKAWVVMAWYLHVTNRPKYGDTVKVTTWVSKINKVECIREFEITNNDGICARVSSKWVQIDMQKRKFTWLLPEKIALYECENKELFATPVKFRTQIRCEYEKVTEHQVLLKDADLLGHMHNLNYYEYAAMTLPESKRREYDNVMILYKNEIPMGEKFSCGYCVKEEKETVFLFQNEKINATVQMW